MNSFVADIESCSNDLDFTDCVVLSFRVLRELAFKNYHKSVHLPKSHANLTYVCMTASTYAWSVAVTHHAAPPHEQVSTGLSEHIHEKQLLTGTPNAK